MKQHPGGALHRTRALPALLTGTMLTSILFLCGMSIAAWSMPDSTDITDEKILFIGQLGFDCVADSVWGSPFAIGEYNPVYLPTRIRWGVSSDTSDMPGCRSKTPRKKRVKQTMITYNGCEIFGGSVAFQSINGDSLADIIIHLQAKFRGTPNISHHSFAIFGQHALDSIPVIHIGSIGRFQVQPYFAMELVRDSELRSPGARDLSGRTSYVLETIDLNLNEQDSTLPPPTGPDTAALAGIGESSSDSHDQDNGYIDNTLRAVMRVYPNPTGNTLRIEAAGLPLGTYTIDVLSVNGETEMRQEVTIDEGAGFRCTLDVSHLAHGYYVVRIESRDAATIVSSPIIITR